MLTCRPNGLSMIAHIIKNCYELNYIELEPDLQQTSMAKNIRLYKPVIIQCSLAYGKHILACDLSDVVQVHKHILQKTTVTATTAVPAHKKLQYGH